MSQWWGKDGPHGSGDRATRDLGHDLRNRLPNGMQMLRDRVMRRGVIQGLTFGVNCREAVEQQGGKLGIPAGRLRETTEFSVRAHHVIERALSYGRDAVTPITSHSVTGPAQSWGRLFATCLYGEQDRIRGTTGAQAISGYFPAPFGYGSRVRTRARG